VADARIDVRLRSSQLHANVERLRKQVELTWPRELQVIVRLGLADGMCVLDIGSGPGYVTEALLELLPNSPVVAVDLDPDMTAMAATRLGAIGGDRFLGLTNSALDLDLPDNCIDFAISRYLFQHLPAPDLALTEIHRVLRPGGRLAIVDIDDALGGIVDPPIPSLAIVGEKVAQLQAQRGGNRYVGRTLWKLLAATGFEGLSIDTVVVHSDQVGVTPFIPQFDPDRYLPFVTTGGLTREEWENYRADFQRFLAAPHPFILHLLLVVSGRKPGAAQPGPNS